MDLQGIQLYFAYGSNLFFEQMKKRYASVAFVNIAYYPNFTLAFTRKSRLKKRKGGWAADMIFSPNDHVWGVVYTLAPSDLLLLDWQEVVHLKDGYLRQKIVVFSPRGEQYVAWTYFVKIKQGNGLPHPLYMKKILGGAEQHNLPTAYIDFLKSTRVLDV